MTPVFGSVVEVTVNCPGPADDSRPFCAAVRFEALTLVKEKVSGAARLPIEPFGAYSIT